jgi:hypothetical protein
MTDEFFNAQNAVGTFSGIRMMKKDGVLKFWYDDVKARGIYSMDGSAPSPALPSATPQPETPSPSPAPVDNPAFAANIPSQIKYMNLIMFEGTLSGVSSPHDILITCHYPNGKTVAKTITGVKNNGEADYPFETEGGGLGSGYITVALAGTGKLLGTYDFTVVAGS